MRGLQTSFRVIRLKQQVNVSRLIQQYLRPVKNFGHKKTQGIRGRDLKLSILNIYVSTWDASDTSGPAQVLFGLVV